MAFSNEWEDIYSENKQLSIWPWSDLVSYFHRYVKKCDTVLELGCGAGANIPFLKEICPQGWYFAIEGSQSIVRRLHERFPELKNNIVCGDFGNNWPFDMKFDLIVDRSSVTHNKTSDIKKILEQVNSHLNYGGKYIGIDWHSTKHSAYDYGEIVEDNYSRSYSKDYFEGMGITHFADKEHMEELFKDFNIEVLEEKVNTFYYPKKNITAEWNIVVSKK
ncbi:MAG: class I SAM-dependent methyltransferase [Selenomonadaceae bacterium]|nr:class I SAM-dependent methyltransferase [Selenomonadaceae bacterium]